MTFSKDSLPRSASATALGELLRRQRQLQQESTSSAPDNAEESDPISSSGLLSFTAATEQLRMQRQLQHESGSSAQGNEESNNIASSNGLRSFTAAPVGSHPRTSRARSLDTLRSILNRAIAVLDDDELEDNIVSSRRDDLNPQQ